MQTIMDGCVALLLYIQPHHPSDPQEAAILINLFSRACQADEDLLMADGHINFKSALKGKG